MSNAAELNVLTLGTDVEPLAEPQILQHVDFRLQAARSSHVGLDVQSLGNPQPLDNKAGDGDQQKRAEKRKSVPGSPRCVSPAIVWDAPDSGGGGHPQPQNQHGAKNI